MIRHGHVYNPKQQLTGTTPLPYIEILLKKKHQSCRRVCLLTRSVLPSIEQHWSTLQHDEPACDCYSMLVCTVEQLLSAPKEMHVCILCISPVTVIAPWAKYKHSLLQPAYLSLAECAPENDHAASVIDGNT